MYWLSLYSWEPVHNVTASSPDYCSCRNPSKGRLGQAFKHHLESLQYRRELGDRRDIAVSLANLAMVAQEKGDFPRAEELYQESLALFLEVEDARNIAAVLANRGSLMNDQLEEAIAYALQE